MVDSKLYTLVEVAELLSVTTATVRTWCTMGKLQGVKLPGGDWRVRKEDLDKMLNQQRRTGDA
jgi:excisionase family DNA binding protein